MVLALLVMIGGAFVGGIILGIANIVSGGKILGENNRAGIIRMSTTNRVQAFSAMIPTIPNKGIHARIVILSTIIGKAASTGKMKTMKDMMTVMAAFVMKESFETSFSFSEFQFKI